MPDAEPRGKGGIPPGPHVKHLEHRSLPANALWVRPPSQRPPLRRRPASSLQRQKPTDDAIDLGLLGDGLRLRRQGDRGARQVSAEAGQRHFPGDKALGPSSRSLCICNVGLVPPAAAPSVMPGQAAEVTASGTSDCPLLHHAYFAVSAQGAWRSCRSGWPMPLHSTWWRVTIPACVSLTIRLTRVVPETGERTWLTGRQFHASVARHYRATPTTEARSSTTRARETPELRRQIDALIGQPAPDTSDLLAELRQHVGGVELAGRPEGVAADATLTQKSPPTGILFKSPFAILSASSLADLLAVMHFREFEPGGYLIRQGDPAEFLLLILSGHAFARVRNTPADRPPVGTFGPGDIVGEISLVTDEPRTADVVAETHVQSLQLSASDFHVLADRHPDLRSAVDRSRDRAAWTLQVRRADRQGHSRISNHSTRRPGWNGSGLRGDARGDRSEGCAEDDESPTDLPTQRAPEVPARSGYPQNARASLGRAALRVLLRLQDRISGHGVLPGTDPPSDDCGARSLERGCGSTDARPTGRCPQVRPWPRHRPPRSQAVQHRVDPGRRNQAARFRHRHGRRTLGFVELAEDRHRCPG